MLDLFLEIIELVRVSTLELVELVVRLIDALAVGPDLRDHAQEAPAPTVESVRAEANGLISAVQSQRNACMDQSAQTLASAKAQIDKLTKELEAARAPKAEQEKK